MTQEEKDLLFRDLCARLPYGVKCQFDDGCVYTLSPRHLEFFKFISNFNLKPYLRPLSSMTEEEQKEFVKFHCVDICPIVITEKLTISNEAEMFDWLNKKMFDYRGLIKKDAAIVVTKENNPYKD